MSKAGAEVFGAGSIQLHKFGICQMKCWAYAAIVSVLASGFGAGSALAQASTVIVRATDVIYAAGNQASFAAQAGGTVPQAVIDIPPDTKAISMKSVTGSLACRSREGCITLDGVTYHDPDGHPGNYISTTGWESISGFSAGGQGYLLGVFLAPNGPSGAAPAAESYPPMNKHARVHRPLLDQTFFIGDGLTKNGHGTRQLIRVPQGATELVLGISDACNGNGQPGCYADNQGSWTVTYKIAP